MTFLISDHLPPNLRLTEAEQARYEAMAGLDTSLLGLTIKIENLALQAQSAECCADISEQCMIGLRYEIGLLGALLIATPCPGFYLLAVKQSAIRAAFRVAEPSPRQVEAARASLRADCEPLIAASFLPYTSDEQD
jgi:hypothetical protein